MQPRGVSATSKVNDDGDSNSDVVAVKNNEEVAVAAARSSSTSNLNSMVSTSARVSVGGEWRCIRMLPYVVFIGEYARA